MTKDLGVGNCQHRYECLTGCITSFSLCLPYRKTLSSTNLQSPAVALTADWARAWPPVQFVVLPFSY